MKTAIAILIYLLMVGVAWGFETKKVIECDETVGQCWEVWKVRIEHVERHSPECAPCSYDYWEETRREPIVQRACDGLYGWSAGVWGCRTWDELGPAYEGDRIARNKPDQRTCWEYERFTSPDQYDLKRMGDERWELVTIKSYIAQIGNEIKTWHVYVFKRQIKCKEGS